MTDDERGLCQMKIGAAPISWGISEFPDWGPQMPYEQVFDEMAKAGYAGTELGPPGYLPLDAELLKLELSRRNLAMIAAFVPVNMRNPTAAKTALADVMRTAELLSHLGATQIIVADDGDGHRRAIAGRVEQTVKAGMATDEWESLVHGLHQAATRCADLGLELCVHPHAGSYIEHPSEIERLLEQTDPNLVKICFDSGHIAFGGGDPLAIAGQHAGRIGIVHLKDIDMERLHSGVAAGKNYVQLAQEDSFTALGEGSLDLKTIVGTLQRNGYDGWIVVEQDRVAYPGTDTLGDAVRNRRYLKDTFGL